MVVKVFLEITWNHNVCSFPFISQTAMYLEPSVIKQFLLCQHRTQNETSQ